MCAPRQYISSLTTMRYILNCLGIVFGQYHSYLWYTHYISGIMAVTHTYWDIWFKDNNGSTWNVLVYTVHIRPNAWCLGHPHNAVITSSSEKISLLTSEIMTVQLVSCWDGRDRFEIKGRLPDQKVFNIVQNFWTMLQVLYSLKGLLATWNWLLL